MGFSLLGRFASEKESEANFAAAPFKRRKAGLGGDKEEEERRKEGERDGEE
jgi:hypothetical protein